MGQKWLQPILSCTWPSWSQLCPQESRSDNVDRLSVVVEDFSHHGRTSYSRENVGHSEDGLTYVSRPKKAMRKRTNAPYIDPIPYDHLQLMCTQRSGRAHARRGILTLLGLRGNQTQMGRGKAT